MENFFELNNQNVVQNERIEPHPSFEKNKKSYFSIEGILTKWNVNYTIDRQHIHLKYSSSEGSGEVKEFIELTERLTLKQFRSRVEDAIWELERGLIGDRPFRVKVWSREVDDLEPKWISNCTLISVPSGAKQTYFLFATREGRSITKFGLDEFELMEL